MLEIYKHRLIMAGLSTFINARLPPAEARPTTVRRAVFVVSGFMAEFFSVFLRSSYWIIEPVCFIGRDRKDEQYVCDLILDS